MTKNYVKYLCNVCCLTHFAVNAIIVELQHLRQATIEANIIQVRNNSDGVVVEVIEAAVMLNVSRRL